MNKQEAIKIKDEILRREGFIYVCDILKLDGVVLINDVLDIINKHIVESED